MWVRKECSTHSADVTSFTIDQRRIKDWDCASSQSGYMVPVSEGDDRRFYLSPITELPICRISCQSHLYLCHIDVDVGRIDHTRHLYDIDTGAIDRIFYI